MPAAAATAHSMTTAQLPHYSTASTIQTHGLEAFKEQPKNNITHDNIPPVTAFDLWDGALVRRKASQLCPLLPLSPDLLEHRLDVVLEGCLQCLQLIRQERALQAQVHGSLQARVAGNHLLVRQPAQSLSHIQVHHGVVQVIVAQAVFLQVGGEPCLVAGGGPLQEGLRQAGESLQEARWRPNNDMLHLSPNQALASSQST
eukprot:GHRQ01035185.1.p1 GENE.GHRQ01035185.1~~GHRQ01035185.1.p1  ORF type:complete len:201 (-),score=27.62 GHRQ01035185.1:47-649(-)